MFATSARSVPCMGFAASFAALQTRVSPDFSIVSSLPYARDSEPSGPLTVMAPGASVTSTLAGSGMGWLPIRDMSLTSVPARPPEGHCAPPRGAANEVSVGVHISGDDAEHFAAHAGCARLA